MSTAQPLTPAPFKGQSAGMENPDDLDDVVDLGAVAMLAVRRRATNPPKAVPAKWRERDRLVEEVLSLLAGKSLDVSLFVLGRVGEVVEQPLQELAERALAGREKKRQRGPWRKPAQALDPDDTPRHKLAIR